MAFVGVYVMIARPDQIEALEDGLRALAANVTACDGSEGAELYRDADAPARFTFLERWRSVDAQKAAGEALGKEAFAPIMAALAAPPESTSLTRPPLAKHVIVKPRRL